MDVFGEALYQYWKGDRKTPLYLRRDDGFVDSSSLKFFFARQPLPVEQGVIPHAHGRTLDIGCGAGRHVLYFQRKGWRLPASTWMKKPSGCAVPGDARMPG